MRLNLNFPVHLHARPPRAKGPRNILVSQSLAVDVPTVGRNVDRVFEAGTAFDPGLRGKTRMRTKPYLLVAHEGRLYRKIADEGAEAGATKAFSPDYVSMHAGDRSSVSFAGKTRQSGNPVANLLQRQAVWRMDAASGKDRISMRTWPPRPRDEEGDLARSPFTHIEGVTLDSVIGHLTDVDSDELAAAMEFMAVQAGKLLAVEGDGLWMETPPPCYIVEYVAATARYVQVHIGHLGETPHPHFERVCFPLSQRDEAFDYARALLAHVSGEGAELADKTVDHEIDHAHDFSFDQGGFEARNLMYLMASTSMRNVQAAPETRDKLLQPDAAVWQEVVHADFVSPPAFRFDEFETVAETWNELGRPSCWATYPGAYRSTTPGFLIERARQHIVNRPITLPAFGF
jgi:hypothetical protein